MKEIVLALIPYASTLFTVWMTWKLSTYSERRKRQVEALEKRLDGFRELRAIADNIPFPMNADDLLARLETEPDFRKTFSQRLVRLFGLRRELVPHLDVDILSFIDERFRPLFASESGTYELDDTKLGEFARCCVDFLAAVNSLEKRLREAYETATK
jgi:hypothetical protein